MTIISGISINYLRRNTPLKLKRKITEVVLGISAGTMNSADIVYAQPELEGESIDSAYQRFLRGLDLTKCMIIPHYQDIKDQILDGNCVKICSDGEEMTLNLNC